MDFRLVIGLVAVETFNRTSAARLTTHFSILTSGYSCTVLTTIAAPFHTHPVVAVAAVAPHRTVLVTIPRSPRHRLLLAVVVEVVLHWVCEVRQNARGLTSR